MDRLQKVIAQAGIASRRRAEEMIKEGRVKVDGVIITEMGFQVPRKAVVEVDGKTIQRESKVYYLLYKPKNVICTNNDEKDRVTASSLIDCRERIYPVGRLDYDTTGILLLTNDGDFSNAMTHPRYHIEKTYNLDIKGILKTEEIKQLEKGILLEGKMTLPARIKVTNKDFKKNQTTLDIRISEGRNHQIKDMFAYFGYTVTRLHRKQFGFLDLKDMQPGDYRNLKPIEIKKLRTLADQGSLIAPVSRKKDE